jgi:uncharacterized protein (TIGR04168 family)
MRLGIVGDVHLAFGPKDVSSLDRAGYDAVLFVGDLAGYSHRGAIKVGKYIAALKAPTFVLPGNHDCMTAQQMFAEMMGHQATISMVSGGEEARVAELRAAIGSAILTGYAVHEIGAISIIAARPHSFGGPSFAFKPYLSRAFGITNLDASGARLCDLVDEAEAEQLIFFAHNGPTGLGSARDAIWGCDFKRQGGDFGDQDLRDAIDHARARGKNVLAVVAGHMHRQLRGSGPARERPAFLRDEAGTLFINAARVPRVFKHPETKAELRHHVMLRIEGERAEAEDVLVPG